MRVCAYVWECVYVYFQSECIRVDCVFGGTCVHARPHVRMVMYAYSAGYARARIMSMRLRIRMNNPGVRASLNLMSVRAFVAT